MKENYRDRDHSRSRSRDRERRGHQNKFSPRESHHRNQIKLHVGNLPLSASEDDIQRQFQRYGRVEDVKIMRKNASGQPLRESLYGFIVMENEEEARRALEMINHNHDLGWHVSYSKEKGRHDDSRRSPDRTQRPKDRFRKESDEDKYHHRNHRRDRSPRRSADFDRRRERSFSPEERRVEERGPAQGTALMNLLNNNLNATNPNMAADLMKILQLPPDKLSELTSSMEKNILNGNTILVRELWLGNLPENLPDKKLKNTVEMFGDVENIEYYNKPGGSSFAFVKFKKVSQASKANEGAASLRLLLDSPNLKIAFSDHQRRRGIVGDNVDYEKDEDLTSIIYIGYSSGAFVAHEGAIREVFSKYGEVLNVMIRQSPKDNSAKSYVLVEMGSLTQAKTARDKISIQDEKREKRGRLGDRNCDLSILVKAKNAPNPAQNMPTKPPQQMPYIQQDTRNMSNMMYNKVQVPQQYQQQPNPYQQQKLFPQHQPPVQNQAQHFSQYPQQPQRPQQATQPQLPLQQSLYPQQYAQNQPRQPDTQPPIQPSGHHGQPYTQPLTQGQQNLPYNFRSQPPLPGLNDQSQRDRSQFSTLSLLDTANNVPNLATTGDQRPINQIGTQLPPSQTIGPGQAPLNQGPPNISPVNQFNRFGGIPVPPNAQQGTFSPNAPQNRQPLTNSPSVGGMRPNLQSSPNADINKPFPFNQNTNLPVAAPPGGQVEAGTASAEKKEEHNNKKVDRLKILDALQTILSQTNANQSTASSTANTTTTPTATQKQEKPEEKKMDVEHKYFDDSNIIWSGFITKSKQNRVGVDAILIEGDETILHRTLFEEVVKRQAKNNMSIALVVFRPSNDTFVSLFNDYLKYFVEKQRAGVVTLKKNTLYILPPSEEVFKIHKFGQNELLGVFSDLSDIPKVVESIS